MGIVKGLSVVLAATALAGIAGCKKTATIPTPVLATEDKSGSLSPGGTSTQTFDVSYSYTGTDASVTLKSVTSQATGSAVTTTLGIAFGSIGFDGSCTRSAQFTAPAAQIGQELPTNTAPFGPNTYCISVFDSGTLTTIGAVNYTITIKHY